MNASPRSTSLGSSMVHTYLRDWEGLEMQNKEMEIEVELVQGKNGDCLDWRDLPKPEN